MSSRQLRKLQKQKELAALEAKVAQVSEDESEDELPIQKPKPSGFAGFAALGGMDDEQEDDDDDDNDVEPPRDQQQPIAVEAPPPKPSAKKNKKKKKKAKKATESASASPSKEPAAPVAAAADDIDEIDRAIQELDLAKKAARPSDGDPNVPASASKPYERICSLLRVNTHHLKVLNEMRHLFGWDTIVAAQNEEQEEREERAAQNRRNPQRQTDLETFLKGDLGKSLPEVTLKRNPFLQGKEVWPRASTEGLSMAHIKDSVVVDQPGVMEFAFVHDKAYDRTENEFFSLVNTYDPMNLVYYLKRHPYHVSTLIQVSKVAKQDQNLALSADLCERALFTFGRVSLSTFRQKIGEGKARLDFRRPENRQFWLAGYHYLKNLITKGTYRTALEWAKLLLSMDPSDPYGMIHFIHPLAIRAYESSWFIDFCNSGALDLCDTAHDFIRQTVVLAKLQQKDAVGAKAQLTEGMRAIPWLYSSLFRALNLDVPRAIWGQEPRNSHESFFVELYIHQAKALWDTPQATALLRETAANLSGPPDYSTFAPTPLAQLNAARFVYLNNDPSLMGAAPSGMLLASPNFDFDPLPPPREDNIFSHDSQQRPWNEAGGRQHHHNQRHHHARAVNLPEDFDDDELLQQIARMGWPIGEDRGAVGDGDHGDDENDDYDDSDTDGREGEGDRGGLGIAAGLEGRFRQVLELFQASAPEFITAAGNHTRIPGEFPEDEEDRNQNHDYDEDTDTDTDDEIPPLIPPSNADEQPNRGGGAGGGGGAANGGADDGHSRAPGS